MNVYGTVVTKIIRVQHPRGHTMFRVTYTGDDGLARMHNTYPGGDVSRDLAAKGIPEGKVDVILNGRHQIVALRPTEEDDAPANPFKPGDWADHKSGTLDAREVAHVGGDMIRLRIGTLVTDPVPAANYDRLPPLGEEP